VDVASSVASVDITLPTGFRFFRIAFANVRGSVGDAALVLRTSSNGGTSYGATAGDYKRLTTITQTSVSSFQDQTSTFFYVSGNVSSVQTTIGASGTVTFTPGLSNNLSSIIASAISWYDAGGAYVGYDSKGFSPTGANALRFLMSNGNIVAGKFTLEGIA
jgi:hypothetical protein